jgi:hypothetical protein
MSSAKVAQGQLHRLIIQSTAGPAVRRHGTRNERRAGTAVRAGVAIDRQLT